MIDRQRAAFASHGRALIVGAVDEAGMPHATRGWGFRLDGDVPVVMLDADDTRGCGALVAERPIAITASDVPTLESVQFKGTSLGISTLTAADQQAVDTYVAAFIEVITEVDRLEPWAVARLIPSRFLPCRFRCEAIFDQTPGPRAGQPLSVTS